MTTIPPDSTPLGEHDVAMPADEATMARRYVRITGRSDNGFVQFEYSVGWPDMALEMALPEALFDDFCLNNKVQFLTEPVGSTLGDNDE